jgi:hypothetical protein
MALDYLVYYFYHRIKMGIPPPLTKGVLKSLKPPRDELQPHLQPHPRDNEAIPQAEVQSQPIEQVQTDPEKVQIIGDTFHQPKSPKSVKSDTKTTDDDLSNLDINMDDEISNSLKVRKTSPTDLTKHPNPNVPQLGQAQYRAYSNPNFNSNSHPNTNPNTKIGIIRLNQFARDNVNNQNGQIPVEASLTGGSYFKDDEDSKPQVENWDLDEYTHEEFAPDD